MKKSILIPFMLIFPIVCLAADLSWPKLKEFDDEFLAYSGGNPIEYIKPLKDINGITKYLLVCSCR